MSRLLILFFHLFLFLCICSCTFFKKTEESDVSQETEEEEFIAESSSEEEEFVDEEEEDVYYTKNGEEEDIHSTDDSEEVATGEEDFDPSFMPEDDADESPSYSDIVDKPIKMKKAKAWIPLKKIPQTSWMHNKKWINTVFIARQEDTLSSISHLIFGNDLSEELKSINPFLKRREVKVGDKIYYSSPNRPTNKEFLIYYEDIDQQPETHDIASGQNIRTVSTQLLGHLHSWKEIWATNLQVESKGVISNTVTVRYWTRNNHKAHSPSVTPTQPIEPEEEIAMTEETVSLEDPLMAEGMEKEEKMEESPSAEMDSNIIDNELMLDPLAEEEPLAKKPLSEPDVIEADDSSVMNHQSILKNWKIKAALIGGVLLIVGFWFFRLIRSRKARGEFDFAQTNIDIDNIEE